MPTSDLLSRMYPVPLRAMKRQQARLTQRLRSMPASRPSETYAQDAYFSNGYGKTSASSLAPYLHRTCWLLTNHDGNYVSGIHRTQLEWVQSANAVPDRHRYSTFQRAKECWLQIRGLMPDQDESISVQPVDFYAHRSTPFIWCALDD